MAHVQNPNGQLTNQPLQDGNTTKINLQHDIQVNGIKYPAGTNVTVPKAQADDIARMDYDYTKQLNERNVKHEYIVNSGSMSVGGGGE